MELDPHIKEKLTIRTLQLYSTFFENENKFSLLDQRDFHLIYNFFLIFENIYKKNSKEDLINVATIIDKITKIVEEDYFNHLKNDYVSFLQEDPLTFNYKQEFDVVIETNTQEIIHCFKHAYYHLGFFIIAYNELATVEGRSILEELLIEFNNFLAHLLKAIINKSPIKNIERAKAHLHRGILDAYKVIIHKHRSFINSRPDLVKEFIELRKKEISIIGKAEDMEKLSKAKSYRTFSKKLL